MSLFLDQKTQTWKLPKGWTVIATSNPDTNDYIVEALDKAQEDRYFTFQMKFDIKQWAMWAEKDGIDEKYILFLLDHPEMINDKITPRAASEFFELITGVDYRKNYELIHNLGEARTNKNFMSLFDQDMHKMKYEIPKAEFVLTHKDYEEVKHAITKCVGDPNKNSYRPDLSWIVMKRIENFLNNNKITSNMVDRFRDIIYDNLLNDNQAYYLAREAILKHKEFEDLLADNKFLNIISK